MIDWSFQVEAEPEMKKVVALFPEDFTATTHDIELSGTALHSLTVHYWLGIYLLFPSP